MDVLSLAIFIIVLIAVVAVVRWFVQSSGVAIPQPLLIVVYAIIAVVAIYFLIGLIGAGPAVTVPVRR